MTLARWIDFTTVTDARGHLVAAEVERHIPFDIRRVYYLRDLKAGEPRGFHAHKALQQVAVCVAGSCNLLLDDGHARETVRCGDPARGLYIGPMVWHEMYDFSPDCVLLVFASAEYDESDYLRSYDVFAAALKHPPQPAAFIHRLSDIAPGATVGAGSRVEQYVVIRNGAAVGGDCNICAHVLIEGDTRIGDRVTLKSGVRVCDGVTLEDDVIVSSNVIFTNDPLPRSYVRPEAFSRTVVRRGARVGANATILPGVTIGEFAIVGAGSVVTRDVPPRAVVYGSPARVGRELASGA